MELIKKIWKKIFIVENKQYTEVVNYIKDVKTSDPNTIEITYSGFNTQVFTTSINPSEVTEIKFITNTRFRLMITHYSFLFTAGIEIFEKTSDYPMLIEIFTGQGTKDIFEILKKIKSRNSQVKFSEDIKTSFKQGNVNNLRNKFLLDSFKSIIFGFILGIVFLGLIFGGIAILFSVIT